MAIRKSRRKSKKLPASSAGKKRTRASASLESMMRRQRDSGNSANGLKAAARKKRARAFPPDDDPALRHAGCELDRYAGEQPAVKHAELRLAAITHLQNMSAPAGPYRAAPVAGASNWVQMGPAAITNGQTHGSARVLVTGRVTAIAIDPSAPSTIYLGAAQGGIWKSTDGGLHWIAQSDNEKSLAIGALAIDPLHPQTIYAGTGEGNFSLDSYYGNGVLKSVDGGSTWTLLGLATFSSARFSRIAINPVTTDTLFAATSFGLYRSTDGGGSWTILTNGLPAIDATDVVIDPATPTTVYAAFWNQGIYRSTDAGAAIPGWTKLTGGLPGAANAAPNGFTRVALGISPSSPQTLFALFANNDVNSPLPGPPFQYAVDKLYVSTNGGGAWNPIALPAGAGIGIGGQGFYNLCAAVDPATPDIVYLGAKSLWKAARNNTGAWTVTEIGAGIHPDNHALAFDPANHLVLYAGCDGGIYKSVDGGTTWDDSINKGLCITQFEFIDQHPTSDALVIAGTQDNGTEMFRNSAVFYHSDDGDGGFTAIDPVSPRNMLSTYYGVSPKRSTQGGDFNSWYSVNSGIAGNGLFYPPMTLDQTNSSNVAFGTEVVNLDGNQGQNGWPVKVSVPGLAANEAISALNYVNTNLIYAGTSLGKVFRLTQSAGVWTAAAIHAAPLPGNYIWDVGTRPGNPDLLTVVMSGYSVGRVWRGAVPAVGAATWTDISGTGSGRLPSIPVNALVIEPSAPDTMYIATDVAVFRTVDDGVHWTKFSEGLPNCAVFDLKLHDPTRLLRAATHGRGMWERKLDVAAAADVDLYVRDHLMHTGRGPSVDAVPAAFGDPLQFVHLGEPLYHWMCADIKVDALEGSPLAYQMPVGAVDYVGFDAKLQHRHAVRGNVNRVYVQVHNRGINTASGVTVKLHYADASAGLPPLPADFWARFPADSTDTSQWRPIGVQSVEVLPTEPTVVEWDWTTPAGQATHSCLLVVIDSPQSPLPAVNRVFDVGALVRNEQRAGLKNLLIVNAAPPTPSAPQPMAVAVLDLHGAAGEKYSMEFRRFSDKANIGFVVSKRPRALTIVKSRLKDLHITRPTATARRRLAKALGENIGNFDTSKIYMIGGNSRTGTLTAGAMPKGGARIAVILQANSTAATPAKFQVVQRLGNTVTGGSNFILRAR